jgi:outer membrane protein TolC
MNRMFAGAALALALFSLISPVGAQSSERPIIVPRAEELLPQLRPVLQAALSQSPRLVGRADDLREARLRQDINSARLYPNIGGSLTWNPVQREERLDLDQARTTAKLYYNFSVTQPLWHWGALRADSHIGKIGYEIAKRNYRDAYRYLALDVRSAYLGLILSKMSVRNARFAEKLARDNYTRQEERLRANLITEGDMAVHQLRVDEAVLAVRQAESDLDFALRDFRQLTGLERFSADDVPETVPVLEAVPALATPRDNSGYLSSLDLEISALRIEQQKLSLRIARVALRPRFNAHVGVSRDEVSYSSDLFNRFQVDTAYAGFTLQWSIWDGFSSRANTRIAYDRLRRYERERGELLENVRTIADREASRVDFAWQAYQNAHTRYRFALGNVDFLRKEFESGTATQEQLDAAQAEANRAEFMQQLAFIQYLNAAAVYASTMNADPALDSLVLPNR